MKKYFFRPHRGGLREAMEGHKFFDTLQEMIDYVVDDWNSFASHPITFDDVTFKLYSERPDRRIGWNCTYIILVEGCGHAFFTDSYRKDWDITYRDFCKKNMIKDDYIDNLEKFVEYIQKRFKEQPFESRWVLPDGTTVTTDVGYISDFIYDILPYEIENFKR